MPCIYVSYVKKLFGIVGCVLNTCMLKYFVSIVCWDFSS